MQILTNKVQILSVIPISIRYDLSVAIKVNLKSKWRGVNDVFLCVRMCELKLASVIFNSFGSMREGGKNK